MAFAGQCVDEKACVYAAMILADGEGEITVRACPRPRLARLRPPLSPRRYPP